MNNPEKSAEFKKQMGDWLKEETGQSSEPQEPATETPPAEEPEPTVDINVSEFQEEAEPATDVIGVQRMLEDMSSSAALMSAELRIGMERYNEGDSLTPKQQGHMELARRMFKDGVTTPDKVDQWLEEQFGEPKTEVKPTSDSALSGQVTDYRNLQPGSPEETAANAAILTELLQNADVPNPEQHAVELRAALRTQAELTDDNSLLLDNLRGIVEQKASSLQIETATEDLEEIELAEVSPAMTNSYDSIKTLTEGTERRAALEGLLDELLPAEADKNQFVPMLDTFMKGDTPPDQALKAVQNQYRKRASK